jgi:predicted transcriptional regulator of viral defense system
MFCITSYGVTSTPTTQRTHAVALLKQRGMARLADLIRAGATSTTIARLERDGTIVRLSRGLYQLPDAPIDTNHSLAEAAALVPRGVVCLVSALAFHELTDQQPARIWMAIGRKSWRPRVTHPPLRIVRFSPAALRTGVKTHTIERVPVRITEPGRTIIDLFRYRRTVGQSIAVDGLKEALRQRRVTPGEIARLARDATITRLVSPYLEALTADG